MDFAKAGVANMSFAALAAASGGARSSGSRARIILKPNILETAPISPGT